MHIDAEKGNMVILCIFDASDHFFTRVDTKAFGHVLLELGKESIEEGLVL